MVYLDQCFFTILTLLLAHYIVINIYRFLKLKKYGGEAKRLPKDFAYAQRIFVAKFKRNLLEQDKKEIKK